MKKILLLCAVLAACSSKHAAQSAAPQEPAPLSGGLEQGMANCPSAVTGAETKLENTPGGVDVFVTAKEADAQAMIVQLAERQARQDQPGGGMHTGQHGGPGTIGFCPIIHDGTQISMDRVEGGAVLHVVTAEPDRVKPLQDEAARRLSEMPKRPSAGRP